MNFKITYSTLNICGNLIKDHGVIIVKQCDSELQALMRLQALLMKRENVRKVVIHGCIEERDNGMFQYIFDIVNGKK